MPFKYTLVVSQYYWSVHSRVVHRPIEFRKVALNFIEELQNYKRSEERPIHFGDLHEDYYREDCRRQNINDSGDIYFVHSDNLEALASVEKRSRSECGFYKDNFDKRTKAYKNALSDVSTHHDKSVFEKLVSKHFDRTAN